MTGQNFEQYRAFLNGMDTAPKREMRLDSEQATILDSSHSELLRDISNEINNLFRQEADLARGTTEAPGLACAVLARELDMQLGFMRFYQTLVAVLAAAAALMVAWSFALLAMRDESWQAIFPGVGAVLSGVAMGFFIKQRADSRERYDNSLAKAQELACPIPGV
jgi:hypothetical protein